MTDSEPDLDVPRRPSHRRAAIIGAVLFAGLPLWTLPLMALGGSGFLTYLTVSHTYYGGARRAFGAALFPAHEFGIVPRGALGLALAGALYGVLGAAAGWALAAGVARWRSRGSP